MSDEQEPTTPPPPPSVPLEERGAGEWVAVGIAAADLALNPYNTFKPSNSAPPEPPPPPPPPQIELPPGVDRE